jgi:hypothetical protein
LKRKNRNRFARLGMLSIALLVSLCVTGIGYAGWTDVLGIDGMLETAGWEGGLSDPDPSVPTSQNITLIVASPNTLEVNVSYAMANTPYTGTFKVNNTGTVPIKIKSIVYNLPSGVTASVSGVYVDDEIEAGNSIDADVHTSTPDGGSSYDFTITFDFALWNE